MCDIYSYTLVNRQTDILPLLSYPNCHSNSLSSVSPLNYLPISLFPPTSASSAALDVQKKRGVAFQKPGDRSPLSAKGPQSDRGIRIRIAAHSPQCPSDELEGERETEALGGEE